jgi:hypothetical protein
MENLTNELISFSVIALVVIGLALFQKRVEDRYKKDEDNSPYDK